MTMLDAILADQLQSNLERAKEVLGSQVALDQAAKALQSFQANADAYREQRRGIEADADLSAAGKRKRLEQAAAQHLSQQEALISAAQSAADTLVSQLEKRIQPQPLHSDEATAQALLANARADARMMLDGAEKGELIRRMGELAQGSDPAVRHLLLATPWPAHYLLSRKASAQEWESAKAQHIAAELGELAGQAAEALPVAREIRDDLSATMRAQLEPAAV